MTDKIVDIRHSGGALTSPSSRLTRYGTPKATIKDVAALLAKLELVYPTRNMTPKEAKLFTEMWAEDLAEYPVETIATAMGEYRRNPENKFFPHPGAIIAICQKIPDPSWAKYREAMATAKDEPYDER